MNRNSVLNDLDRMLAGQKEDVEESGSSPFMEGTEVILQAYSWPDIKVKSTSVNLVALLVDDSGSMNENQVGLKMIEAAKAMIDELRLIARNQKETYIAIRGFRRSFYYVGNVLNSGIKYKINKMYFGNGTPLAESSLSLVEGTREFENELSKKGINTTVSMLIMTDGFPNSSDKYEYAPKFYELIKSQISHWRVSGMGILPDDEDNIQGYREGFTDTFDRMGIKRIITPNSDELKAALYQFSKSVSAVS